MDTYRFNTCNSMWKTQVEAKLTIHWCCISLYWISLHPSGFWSTKEGPWFTVDGLRSTSERLWSSPCGSIIRPVCPWWISSWWFRQTTGKDPWSDGISSDWKTKQCTLLKWKTSHAWKIKEQICSQILLVVWYYILSFPKCHNCISCRSCKIYLK